MCHQGKGSMLTCVYTYGCLCAHVCVHMGYWVNGCLVHRLGRAKVKAHQSKH